MLYWASVFFVVSLIGAFFGFSGFDNPAAGVAKVLFIVFLILSMISLMFGRVPPTFSEREEVVPGNASIIRPYYFVPFCAGLATYCFSHDVVRPSISSALGAFFVSLAVVLIVKSVSSNENY